ncbi:MFS transporter [Myxococcota bacterium]|nr:MFS transporter [Myxococcota bacterium]
MFYGWVVVAAIFTINFVMAGTAYYSYSIIFKDLVEDLGSSRAGVSLALPLTTIVSSALGPLVGREADRRSLRGIMLLGAVFVTVGFYCLSVVTELWQLLLVFGGPIAIGQALCGGIPTNALVTHWFERRRGTAIGISQVGVSMSGVVMVWVASWLVAEIGWRGLAQTFTWVPLVVIVPLVLGVIVEKPADRGLQIDGRTSDPEKTPSNPPATDPTSSSVTSLSLLRTHSIWIIAFAVGSNFAASGAVLQQLHVYLTDHGHSSVQAVSVLSVLTSAAVLGKLLAGLVSDAVGGQVTFRLLTAAEILGLSTLALADGLPWLWVGAVLFGVGFGGMLPLWSILIAAVFGPDKFGRAMGACGLLMIPFQFLGAPTAGYIFDTTGSYAGALILFLSFYLIAGVWIGRVRPEGPRLEPA